MIPYGIKKPDLMLICISQKCLHVQHPSQASRFWLYPFNPVMTWTCGGGAPALNASVKSSARAFQSKSSLRRCPASLGA